MLQKENNEEDLKLKIQMRRDEIVVNNQVVLKQVHSPTAQELLKMPDDKKERVMNTKLIPAEEHFEQGSEYYTYIQKVKSVSDIQNGLLKMRIKHGDATHVSCAYRLDKPIGPFNQEGHNDREIGTERVILSTLKQSSVKNICVYVVRYFGGVRLGSRRFKILEMVTKAEITMYSFKSRERQTRMFRADSQESIISQISALSYEGQEPDDEEVPEAQVQETDNPIQV